MFSNDKRSMLDMYNSSISKTNYKRVLVTFQLLDLDLKLSEAAELIHFWKLAIKSMLGINDAALEINDGNIFILLHISNQKQFDKRNNEFIMETSNLDIGVKSSLIYLDNQEAEFLLKISK